MTLARSYRATTRIGFLEESRAEGEYDDLSGLMVHLRGATLAILTYYLRPSIGLSGVNKERLAKLGAFLLGLGVPWLLFADFNLDSALLQEWLSSLNAGALLPEGASFTSRAGGCRMYDYVIYSVDARCLVLSLSSL